MDDWEMPADVRVAQWAAASGGHSGNQPLVVPQGFPYKHAWGELCTRMSYGMPQV